MEDTLVETLAGPLVLADRNKAMAELKEAILDLKGDAVGRGRLRTGFFVEDLFRLCKQSLNRRAQEILDAYDSALSAATPEAAAPAEIVLSSMRRELLQDAEDIGQAFQQSLLRDHLRVPDPLANALERCESSINARGRVLLEQHAQRRIARDFGRADSTHLNAVPPHDTDILELRPNFFGLGINLRAFLRRLCLWRSRRRVGGKAVE